MKKVAPPCIWPACHQRISAWPETKLCDKHLAFVVREYESVLTHIEERRADRIIRPASLAAPDEPSAQGTIYFVQVGGHIKIGWTSDLTKRMHAYPPNAILLAAHPGLRKDEWRLHKMFAAHRSHGREWYPLAPVILEHIKRVVAEHGQPDEVAFGAKPVEVPRPHSTSGRPHPRGWPADGSPKTVRG